MKSKWKTMYWSIILVWFGCIPAFAKPFAVGPYFGQAPPGPVAQVFAPGLICDTRPQTWEAFGTFSADGKTFCFMRGPGVFITENTDQGWTAPELITSIPSKIWAPWSPCLSPDANSIFFTISLLKPLNKRNLYRCNRTARKWATPQQLGPPFSSPAKEITCSIASNNNIYLGSTRKGAYGRGIIWVIPFEGNTWVRDEHFTLNFPGGDWGIAPDESFIVLTAKDLPGGYGHRDIYLSLRLPDGTWSKPQNLGPRINTAYIEHGPRISPDKKYLFFDRSNGWYIRKHSADIYWVELKEYLPESYR